MSFVVNSVMETWIYCTNNFLSICFQTNLGTGDHSKWIQSSKLLSFSVRQRRIQTFLNRKLKIKTSDVTLEICMVIREIFNLNH